MKAVAYTRVSTDEQVHGTSLDSQKRACMEFAKHKGMELKEENVFREEGVSAKLIDRPQLTVMLDYCAKHKGEITHCIVWKVDRLARKSEYHHYIKATLAKFGIKLVSVTEPIGDDPMGNLLDSVLAGFAQFDNEIRLARTTGGMRARTQQGGWPHDAPAGYKKWRTPTGVSSIEPNENQNSVIDFLIEFSTGAYTIEQARFLAFEYGITDTKGKVRRWQSIKNLLTNPLYAGFVQSKYTDGELIKGVHKALISERTYYKNKAIVAGSLKSNSRQAEPDWPLRGGFLKHTCGRDMTGGAPISGNGQPSARYCCIYCRAKVLGARVSKMRNMVHDDFVELLNRVRPTEETQKLFKAIVLRTWNNEFKDALAVSTKVDAELAELKNKKSRTIDLFIEGKLTEDDKNTKIQEIEEEIAKQNLQRLDADAYVQEKEQIIDGAMLFMSEPATFWNLAELPLKKRVQDLIFPEGLVYDCEEGFRTAVLNKSYLLMAEIAENNAENTTLVAPSGLEPLTPGL